MPKAFAAACKQFFGMRPGQPLGEFANEIKALTQPDRDEMAALMSVELEEEVSSGSAIPAAQ